jgi:Ca2+-transporting ATPase
MSRGAVARELTTSLSSGLEPGEARARLARLGPNVIEEGRRVSPLAILASQFQDFMVLVLLGATAISAVMGEYKDVAAILAIVIINAVLGFIQEFRAERALAALARLSAPRARVVRGGRVQSVDASQLVPGDIILLSPGDRVPADARLFESHNLETDESVLTGESHPVAKDENCVIREQAAISDRHNMVWAGTVVTKGRGRAAVVATGMDTEMGQIARLMRDVSTSLTPLQRRLEQLGRWLVAICLGVCSAMVAMGVARGEPAQYMFLAGVSLAVAAIPEGLPAIVTVSLAMGVQRMSARRAVVRKLAAVETLGCATVICTDKTGTLTENQLTVVQVRAGANDYVLTGTGYSTQGRFRTLAGADVADPAARDPALAQLLLCAVLCNDATLTARSDAAAGITGDPTEAALLVMAAKAGRTAFDEARLYQRVDELPFSSDTKMMAVVCSGPYGPVTFVKGASSAVMPLCSSFAPGLSPAAVTSTESHMADGAMRVLALAWADGDLLRRSGREVLGLNPGLTMLGLVGMVDPVRPEATEAIKNATLAGVRTIMITGDSPATAVAIARAAGLVGESATPETAAVTGEQLDQMDDARLRRVLDRTSVFARVAPAHKLRIVRALKARGQVVAMTGDGVNDAPALREADIGIAMGLSGTDVAREAASMVLTDDNYATIVAAIEEGRSIYDNIRKFIRYLLASNIGEILTMLGTVAAGLPLPLTPIQLLWMNLLTDGLPAMALAADPTDPAVMKRPPRSPSEGVFSGGLGLRIAAQGVFMGACTVACYILAGVVLGRSIDTARTMAFSTLVMSQFIYVFQCRSEGRRSSAPAKPNLWLVAAVAVSVVLQAAVVHTRLGRQALGTTELSAVDWGLVLFLSGWSTVLTSAARSLRRALRRRFPRRKGQNRRLSMRKAE